MKLLICAVLIALANATPLYQDGETPHAKTEDWRLIPDENYNLHLVDVNAVDEGVIPAFNGLSDIIFQLFTRSNPTEAQNIQIGNTQQIQASNFNPALQTRFHIHGWLGGGGNDVRFHSYRDAYLAHGNFNFFAVDWSAGGQTVNYILARQRVGECGRGLAAFIDFLHSNGLPFSAVTVLGHSLGAHCAGHAGKQVTLGRIPIIVGLDPAGPLFSIDSNDRLEITDANYVETIVTDSEFLGFELPLGDANYYVNWGSRQPGCEGELAGTCSHQMVAHFMVHSINPVNIFGAVRCRDINDIRSRNCVVAGPSGRMGGEPIVHDTSPPGSVYFLTTDPTPPFAHGPR